MGKGKPKHPIRAYFKFKRGPSEQGNKGKLLVFCPYCMWETVPNATRQTDHLKDKCTKVPETIRDKVRKLCSKKYKQPKLNVISSSSNVNHAISSSTDDEDSEAHQAETGSSTPKDLDDTTVPIYSVKPQRQRTLQSYVDTVSDKEQADLNSLFASAVYATATSFRHFEHPKWVEFFTKLRPSFKLPSAFLLSGRLLDSEYQAVKAMTEEKIGLSESLCISVDGWTNTRRQPVMNVYLYTPEPIFVKSVFTGGSSHTGEYIASIVQGTINERDPDKIYGFVADNASNMCLAGQLIEHKYDHVNSYGCAMHGFHLLIEDLGTKVGLIKEVISVCSRISVSILNKPTLLAIFNEKQEHVKKVTTKASITLKIPGKTRFGSNFSCLKGIQINQGALRALSIDSRICKKKGKKLVWLLEEDLKNEILSSDFFVKLENVIELGT